MSFKSQETEKPKGKELDWLKEVNVLLTKLRRNKQFQILEKLRLTPVDLRLATGLARDAVRLNEQEQLVTAQKVKDALTRYHTKLQKVYQELEQAITAFDDKAVPVLLHFLNAFETCVKCDGHGGEASARYENGAYRGHVWNDCENCNGRGLLEKCA